MEGACELCRSIEGSSLELMLQNASQSEHEECVRTLIEAGADVNWLNEDTNNTSLTLAAREGHENCMRLLVDAGADVNLAFENASDDEEIEDANTPLMLAAGNGHVNSVQLLIESGADVNATTKYSYTAVHGAVLCGNEACLDLLVKAGADVNVYHNKVYHESHGTPLQMICREGKLSYLVKPLLDAGAIVEEYKLPHEKPLLLAACAGHYEFIDALIQAGADVNSRGFYEVTSLMYAALTTELESEQTDTVNNRRCLDLLLKAGADVNMVDRQGFSSLMYAAKNDNCYALKHLLQAEADVNIKSESKEETALILVLRQGCAECTTALIAAGADVNIANSFGATALICAANKGSNKCTEILIKAGADVNETTSSGFSALMCAAGGGFYDCARTLINAGADVNKSTTSGFTVLMCAAQGGFYECLRTLISAGADVNMVSTVGETALFHALNVNSIKVLLGFGAKINIRNRKGWNALQNWIRDKDCKYKRKLLKCLFAAGESPDNTTVRRIPVRDYVKEPGIILKQMCRDAIRNHLLEMDSQTHLFDQVPKLGLPELLNTYLLYDMCLDTDDNDDVDDDGHGDA